MRTTCLSVDDSINDPGAEIYTLRPVRLFLGLFPHDHVMSIMQIDKQ